MEEMARSPSGGGDEFLPLNFNLFGCLFFVLFVSKSIGMNALQSSNIFPRIKKETFVLIFK
jgi:hypothetical protein